MLSSPAEPRGTSLLSPPLLFLAMLFLALRFWEDRTAVLPTARFVGADLKALVNEAGLSAVSHADRFPNRLLPTLVSNDACMLVFPADIGPGR